jgi:transforming growth factor-beta-induced protein
MRPTRKLRGALALVVGLSLAAAACSDGGDDSATSDEPAPIESPAPDVAGDTDPATICDPAGLVEAVESGPDQGTLAGMTDDPVATAASSNPVLTTLVTAVTEADLVDTLNSADAVTVFAPTDCAFAALDPATLDAALADPTGLLTQVLGFHVVAGQRLSSADLANVSDLETFTGAVLPVESDGDTITVGGGRARVVVPDIQTANATVHLIDHVMVPPAG